MPDGTRLASRLWLPLLPGNAPVPAILEYIPYRKRDMARARDARNHPFFARNGYACVRVDMRGSGDSEGLMSDMYGTDERDDALAVIAWIARQPWCSGRVGMMGTSWGGTSALQTAARRPPALKAVIAVCATDNRFDDDIHHMGGCLLTDSVEWGATLPAILAAPPDPATVGSQWRAQWQKRLEALSFPLEHWIRHETRDAYWRNGSVSETPGAIACPALLIGGWCDRYSNTVMNLLARAQGLCWGIVGPWGHHYPDVAAPRPGIGFQQEALRWWDHWLKNVSNGVDEAPRLRVWLQDYTVPRDTLDHRPGRWISEVAWPSPQVSSRRFWLNDGRLATVEPAASDKAQVTVSLEVGSAAGDTGYFGRAGGLPGDQAQEDALCLVFETPPLAEPLTVLGAVRLEVSLCAEQPIATLVARLNDVPRTGPSARVTYAVRNLALDADGERHRLKPATRHSFVLDFANTAYRFARGHRIRLALSSVYWPIIWPAPVPAQLELHLAGTRLSLPVRQRQPGETPVQFADQGDIVAESPPVESVPPLRRRTLLHPETRRRSIQWHQPFKCVRFAEIDLDFGFETRADHSIDLDDPASAATRIEHRLHFKRGARTVEIVSVAELTSTPATYNPRGTLEVRENGERVFRREWAPVIPRTCS